VAHFRHEEPEQKERQEEEECLPHIGWVNPGGGLGFLPPRAPDPARAEANALGGHTFISDETGFVKIRKRPASSEA
jgi:hypothetical protein